MGIANLKCRQCGAAMERKGEKAAACPSCGASIVITDDVVNNYSSFQTTQHITKNIYGGDQPDADIYLQKGETYLGLNEYAAAAAEFEKAARENPGDHRAWLGILRGQSKNLTAPSDHKELMAKVRKTAPAAVLPEIEKAYSVYEGKMRERDRARQAEFERQLGIRDEPVFSAAELKARRQEFLSNQKNKIVLNGGVLVKCKAQGEIIFVPEGTAEIAANAFVSFFFAPSAKWVILPEGLKVIRARAFFGVCELLSISIPSSVETIEAEAFLLCKKLRKVTYRGKPEVQRNAYDSPAMTFAYPDD